MLIKDSGLDTCMSIKETNYTIYIISHKLDKSLSNLKGYMFKLLMALFIHVFKN